MEVDPKWMTEVAPNSYLKDVLEDISVKKVPKMTGKSKMELEPI